MAELSQHPDVVDLSEYAEGLLDDSRRAAVDHHVRGCPDCPRTLSDLAALPQALAAAPLPPLPADVADRLDRAIAAESQARASGWSGAARAAPLRPRRRWLAPVVAAAAVFGAVAVAVPVLNDESGSDDTATEMSTGAESSRDEGGNGDAPEEGDAPPRVNAPSAGQGPPQLTSDSFGRDVIDAFYYSGSRELKLSIRSFATSGQPGTDRYYAMALGELADPCGAPTVSDGTVDDVTYDGEPAFLLRQEAGRAVDVIAYSCVGSTPAILDAVTLRPRS